MTTTFTPHFIDGSFYSCSREELGAHLDEILDFIDENKSAAVFIMDNGKPTLIMLSVEEYEKRKLKSTDFHDRVELMPHQAVWEERFAEESTVLKSALENIPCTVTHIGSTAVDGMMAKPIMDILLTVSDTGCIPDVIQKLLGLGYTNLGECGREGRFFLSKGNEPNETFYVHLTTPDNSVAQDQLLFTELLRSNPTIREAYQTLKQDLAEAYPTDRDKYRKQKSSFIEGVLLGYRCAGKQYD